MGLNSAGRPLPLWVLLEGGAWGCLWVGSGWGAEERGLGGRARFNTHETRGRMLCEQAPTGLENLDSWTVFAKTRLIILINMETNRA